MEKVKSFNEKEQREAVHAALTAEGVEVTKTLVDKIMDKQSELAFNALVAGSSIKFNGLGTLEVRPHTERKYKLPNGTMGTAPAGFHVGFVESDKLLEAMNAPVENNTVPATVPAKV
jgi:nucleoid DNA-binding protein